MSRLSNFNTIEAKIIEVRKEASNGAFNNPKTHIYLTLNHCEQRIWKILRLLFPQASEIVHALDTTFCKN